MCGRLLRYGHSVGRSIARGSLFRKGFINHLPALLPSNGSSVLLHLFYAVHSYVPVVFLLYHRLSCLSTTLFDFLYRRFIQLQLRFGLMSGPPTSYTFSCPIPQCCFTQSQEVGEFIEKLVSCNFEVGCFVHGFYFIKPSLVNQSKSIPSGADSTTETDRRVSASISPR